MSKRTTDRPYIKAAEFALSKTWRQRILFLLRYGVLAPSSHNTQPWLFKVNDNLLSVRADQTRRLPIGDKTGRMICEGVGCAIENICVAAEHFGLGTKITYDPNFDKRGSSHIADILFFIRENQKNTEQIDLFDAIVKRATYRGPYLPRHVSKVFLDEARALNDNPKLQLHFVKDDPDREILSEIIGDGMKYFMARRDFRWELAGWLRSNYTKQKDGMPGYGHEMSIFVSLIAPWILRLIDVSRVEQKKAIRRVKNFPILCFITAAEDTPEVWVRAGRLMERILLFIYARGMAASIMVAGVESKRENERIRAMLLDRMGDKGTPQTFLGFGYPERAIKYSARRPINDVVHAL